MICKVVAMNDFVFGSALEHGEMMAHAFVVGKDFFKKFSGSKINFGKFVKHETSCFLNA